MNDLDVFYRAYQNYKKEFANNRSDHLFKKASVNKKDDKDFLILKETVCHIETDWIEALEKGIVYLEKAIKEDRQFIRNEGEVLPIEKIRRVSKDSVIDLSKHSDYISKLPENPSDNIIPEKLLMINRENDYLIYENRVLYTTLSYLFDFVSVRLEKIRDSSNKYEGNSHIEKKVVVGSRTVKFNMDLTDVRLNDEYALKRKMNDEVIKRLDLLLSKIVILLRTPLMQEVSKAPMVKRPIVKTNVLKMDNNFKESLAAYDFACAYDKPGYTIREESKKICPLNEEQQTAFSDIILLSSFLTYEFNNYLSKDLKDAYEKEEERRKEESDKKILDRIDSLLGKAKESGMDIGEYLLALEDGYIVLKNNMEELKSRLAKIVTTYEAKISEIKLFYEDRIETMQKNFEDILQTEMDKKDEEKRLLIEEYEEKIRIEEEEKEQKDQEIAGLNNQILAVREDMKKCEADCQDKIKQAEIDKEAAIEEVNKKLILANAEVLAIKIAAKDKGVIASDFTERDRFTELEAEKRVLDEFFNDAWKKTRRSIRERLLKVDKKKYQAEDDDKYIAPVEEPTTEEKVEPINPETIEGEELVADKELVEQIVEASSKGEDFIETQKNNKKTKKSKKALEVEEQRVSNEVPSQEVSEDEHPEDITPENNPLLTSDEPIKEVEAPIVKEDVDDKELTLEEKPAVEEKPIVEEQKIKKPKIEFDNPDAGKKNDLLKSFGVATDETVFIVEPEEKAENKIDKAEEKPSFSETPQEIKPEVIEQPKNKKEKKVYSSYYGEDE